MRVEECAKDMARMMAIRSDCRLYKHGAVIIKDGRIIAVGRNYFVTGHSRPTKHAEIDAITRTDLRALRGATIVVYGSISQRARHRQHLSRPCPNCEAVLRKLKFRRAYFSTNTGWDYINF